MRIETSVLELEPLGELEVELDGSDLVLPLHRVGDIDIDLRSVKLAGTREWKVSDTAEARRRTREEAETYGSILREDLPVSGLVLLEHALEGRLGLVPDSEVSHELLGITGREPELELESEAVVDLVEEVEQVFHFGRDLEGKKDGTSQLRASGTGRKGVPVSESKGRRSETNLLGHAEDVRVVLHETPDPTESSQTSARLVPVQHSELGHPDGELLMRA